MKKILVAPLNWGLGHATRCIPIIRELQRQGTKVLIASDGRALDLLRHEFPILTCLSLPGYNIAYRSKSLIWNVATKVPHLLHAIRVENRLIQQFVKQHQLDGIISDNRLGCHSAKIPCVYLTHQIDLIVPNLMLQKMARQLNYRFIRKYNECWVCDVESEPNLSGSLSHGTPIEDLKFIGALSRLESCQDLSRIRFGTEKRYNVIAVLSGPEPQRTRLEKLILEQARQLSQRFLIVQGKPEVNEHSTPTDNIEIASFLDSRALNEAILASDIWLGRSGYSSLMDLAKLGKRAIFIPTPGQTEQEYLADRLHKQGSYFSQRQEDFDLKQALVECEKLPGLGSDFFDGIRLENTIANFLATC